MMTRRSRPQSRPHSRPQPGPMRRRSRMPALEWMRQAGCQEHPGLPWIGPPHDDWSQLPDPITDVARMRQICDACPVQAACEAFVQDAEVTAGFWAGRWRRDRNDMPRRGRRAA